MYRVQNSNHTGSRASVSKTREIGRLGFIQVVHKRAEHLYFNGYHILSASKASTLKTRRASGDGLTLADEDILSEHRGAAPACNYSL